MNLPEIEKLFIEYAAGIRHLLLKMTKSEDTADDLLQEVFVQAIKYHNSDVEKKKAWLYSIAYNLFKKHYNTIKKLQLVSSESYDLPDKKNACNEIDFQEIKKEIIKKLEEKNEAYGPIFILRLDNELTYEEIARVIGVSKRTVLRYFENIRKIIYKNFKNDITELNNWHQ
ncbi:MAG: RNA polymerase sigma factor [Spirochaetia bacterium]|nr:RNA polymerase sigma factor [Spirochaetia bacterium]